MSHEANQSHTESRMDLLESIDVDVFIEHIDPDWQDHFMDTEQAYYHYSDPVSGLDPQKFFSAIRESGCKL